MSDKRFKLSEIYSNTIMDTENCINNGSHCRMYDIKEVVDLLNEQQELIEELQVSDEMGWKRAERFEKKCPKELHNKKMYIKRLEYKVQKFKEENEQLRQVVEEYRKTNKHLSELCADASKNGYLPPLEDLR